MSDARFVNMQALLDALDTRTGEARFFLDKETGEVEVALEGPDVAAPGEEGARFLPIPRRPPGRWAAALKPFLAGVDDPVLHARLSAAVNEPEFERARRSVHALLADQPLWASRLAHHARQALLADALTWLRQHGIEPLYELAPDEAPRKGTRASLGLWELLLLGEALPDQGGRARVGRRVVARDPEQARRWFESAARELAARAGEPTTAEALARDVVVVTGAHAATLTVRARVVELEAHLPAGLRASLSPDAEMDLDAPTATEAGSTGDEAAKAAPPLAPEG